MLPEPPRDAVRADGTIDAREVGARFQGVRMAYQIGRNFGERAVTELEAFVVASLRELDSLARAVADANVHSVEILERQEELTRRLDAQNRVLIEQNARFDQHRRELEAQIEAMALANVDAVFMMEASEEKLAALDAARARLAELNQDLDLRARELERQALALADSNAEAILMMAERERELTKLGNQNRSLQNENRQLENQAFIDGLTGLFNHRYFREQLALEVARSRRYGRPLSLIFVDADHFKQINDDFGHQVGDDVLKQIAEVLSSEIRGADISIRLDGAPFAVRYGGEEFVVILPETPIEGAQIVAERLRARIEVRDILRERGCRVTVSAGVATVRGDDASIDDVVRRADAALYRAKRTGRNRVVVATTALSDPPGDSEPQ